MNVYLDSNDVSANMGIAWAYGFKSTKRKAKKVYPKLDIPLRYLLNFSEAVVEYSSFDDSSDIEGSKSIFRVMPQNSDGVRNAIEPW